MLEQKGTRVLTHELKEELDPKAEVRVAEKKKSERLEKKRQEKVFDEAMPNSAIGPFSFPPTCSWKNY